MTEQGKHGLDPDDLYAEAIRMFAGGWDMDEVAEALGVNVVVIRTLWHRYFTEQVR